MEANGNDKIIRLLENIISITAENDEVAWSKFLQRALNNFMASTDKKEGAAPIIRTITGGAGSLGDLVLHKDGKPLIDENDLLHQVMHELYVECKKIN
jgi:hypothetical protein